MKVSLGVQNKGKTLGTIVSHSFLKTALTPILIVELLLLCLYFFSVNYITDKNLDLIKTSATETVSEISKTEAKYFDDQLREISRNSRSLQTEHQELFKNKNSGYYQQKHFISNQFDESPNVKDNNVYISTKTPLSSEVSEKIVRTEKMTTRFKTLVDNNPNLVSANFLSWDNMVRGYPVIENFYDKFPHDFEMTEYLFYYRADMMHNPKRETVWTNAYLDPAGKGWMISSLTPIYNDYFLEGVTGLHVTLNTFSKHTLSNDLQWESGAMVADWRGNILTMSRAAEKYLGLSDYSNHNTKDSISDRELTAPTEINLFDNSKVADGHFSEFIKGPDKTKELTIQGEKYLITKQKIPETGWQLLILAPLQNVYGPILSEKERIIEMGVIFLSLVGIFYTLFFVYLSYSAKSLAKRITAPIAKVEKMIKSYSANEVTQADISPVNITELDNLLSMNFEIRKAKERYQQISKEMEIKNEQLRVLSITDQLTQLYNRLKLDEVLGYEVARSSRDGNPLSIAIIDIDKFKSVNDTYGHQQGDSVLIGVSQIMLNNIRSTDILGRWGGEEFMLILPNTPLHKAAEHADKLRKMIEKTLFNPVGNITISLGLASCVNHMSVSSLVELADGALYRAKQNGRNRLEVANVEKVINKPSDSFLVSQH